ncbi:helix-turn-helix transcriptional regulator [bacterium]|nr:helix-turn-helix transcriptional regulator [bacterium]
MNKELLNTHELSEYLNINEKKIYSLIMEKGLPATKVTGKWLFPKHLVDIWIDNNIQNYPWMKEKKLETFNEALIIAGSNDMLLENLLALFQDKHRDILPLYSSIGSMKGINALKKGWCHICAAHMLQKEDEDYNLAYIKDMFHEGFMIVNFAYRTQGLILEAKNPKNVQGIKDIARPDIKIVNRQSGTGTRFLLEYELERNNIDIKNVKGYNTICLSHLDVGIEILSGRADIGLGIQAVAQILGLAFIPLRNERFDLIVRKDLSSDIKIQTFVRFLRSKDIRDYSQRFAGYDLKDMGLIIYEE